MQPINRLSLCRPGRTTVFLPVLFFVLALSTPASAQSPLGTWKTVDHETGEAKSHLRIFQREGQLFGKIVKLIADAPTAICEHCKDEFRDQPILGLEILRGLTKKGNAWKGGRIFDPERNMDFPCKIWLEDEGDTLKVRGYFLGFYKTQTWERVE